MTHLFQNVRAGIDRAKVNKTTSLKDELEYSRIGLKPTESIQITNLINAIDLFQENKGQIIEIIKQLIIITESIEGNKRGEVKKEECEDLFLDILTLVGVSQRDRKIYVAIFDNVVELAFWGRKFFKSRKWFSCCV